MKDASALPSNLGERASRSLPPRVRPGRASMLALFATASVLSLADGCICGEPPSGTLTSCVELEDISSDTSGRLPSDTSGHTIPIRGTPVADAGFVPRESGCSRAANSLTFDLGAPTGRVRFSWESDATHLDVHFVPGELVVDSIEQFTFNGGSSFVISDASGLALGVDTTGGQSRAGPLTIEQGSVRATGFGNCGTYSTTAARISGGAAVTEVDVGSEKTVHVDDENVAVHVFSSLLVDGEWHCTDSGNSLVWSLARK
jgi:hypothetical protein